MALGAVVPGTFLSLETRRTFHHGPRTLHGSTQKLSNHSFKLTVRNLDASSDITKGSIFCAFYCFLCIVGFELAVILKQCSSSMYSLCLLMTASYEVSVGTSKGRTRTQKDFTNCRNYMKKHTYVSLICNDQQCKHRLRGEIQPGSTSAGKDPKGGWGGLW